MNIQRRFSTVLKSLAVCATLVGAGAGFAQEKKAEALAAAPTHAVIEQVEMRGATMGQLVEYLKQTTNVSYVITEEAKDYRIPDVLVRKVTPREVMETVMMATNGEVHVNLRERGENDVGKIFAISLSQQGRERVRPSAPEVRVYVFEGFKDKPAAEFNAHAEKVAKAFKVGEGAAGFRGPAADIRQFGEGAMLFGRGTPEQLALLDQVVAALGGTLMINQNAPTNVVPVKRVR